MTTTYGQFCPVAKAMEVLDERWTMLLIRELISGSRHFNDLRRGVPRMSPTLLSKRLRTLMRRGVIERHTDGNRVTYELTPAGRELAPIIEQLGTWGIRWAGDLGDEDLDPHLLMWDIHRNIDLDAVPSGRTVLHFVLHDVDRPADRWWMVVAGGTVDVCDFDPGHPVTVTIESGLRSLTQLWRGDISWRGALDTGAIRLHGPTHMRRAVPRWLKLSAFAGVPRPVPVPVGAGVAVADRR